VERYTEALAAELSRNGDRVSIATRAPDPRRPEIGLLRERFPDASAVYRFIGGSVKFEQFLEQHEQLERLFMMALLESEPEVVHINHLQGLSPRFPEIAHRMGAAVVVSLHDFYFACPRVHLQKRTGELCEGPDHGRECDRSCFVNVDGNGRYRWGLRATYFRKVLASAESIIAYSNYVAEYFRRLLGGRKPIRVIANGILLRPGHNGQDPFSDQETKSLTIAYCGTVAPHKGPHVLLEALRLASIPSINVLIIGHMPEPDYTRKLRLMASEVPGLKIRMYGRYEPKELSFLLRDVDCVVVPSLVPEAGPIVPREALAMGVPIIAAALGALPEIVVDGENGLTFDPARPDELAAILRKIANNPLLLQPLRAGARRTPVISVADHAEQIRLVYRDAIEGLHDTGDLNAERSDLEFVHENLLKLGCDRHAKFNRPTIGVRT
jgi:glycosyltransferase involved in cell wall biosynthesis